MERFASSTLSNRRYSSVPCLQISSNINHSTASLPTSITKSSTLNSSKFFIPNWSTSSSPFIPTHHQFTRLEREEIDRDFLQIFNIIPNEMTSPSKNSSQ